MKETIEWEEVEDGDCECPDEDRGVWVMNDGSVVCGVCKKTMKIDSENH